MWYGKYNPTISSIRDISETYTLSENIDMESIFSNINDQRNQIIRRIESYIERFKVLKFEGRLVVSRLWM